MCVCTGTYSLFQPRCSGCDSPSKLTCPSASLSTSLTSSSSSSFPSLSPSVVSEIFMSWTDTIPFPCLSNTWTMEENILQLTLKVLNFWKFTTYCNLKTLMVGHGGSSAGLYLADPTSPIPSHCASIVATSTLRVNFYYDNHATKYSSLSLSNVLKCCLLWYQINIPTITKQ